MLWCFALHLASAILRVAFMLQNTQIKLGAYEHQETNYGSLGSSLSTFYRSYVAGNSR